MRRNTQTTGRQRTRRGSALILIVAVLALLAVLTVAYVSIGGGDRRAARAVTRQAEVERQAAAVGQYLAGVVGEDALSVYLQGFDPAGQPILVREATDYPLTDPSRTFDGSPAGFSPPVPQSDYYGLRFTPEGSLPPIRPADDPTDDAASLWQQGSLLPFGPSDPFLASPEPEFLRPAGVGLSTPLFADRVDWAKISNFHPNGLFVNLQNLRDNFEAEPGLGSDAQGEDRMSENLSLPGTRPDPFFSSRDPRVPAHLDSYQVGAYRPTEPSTFAVVDPADADYPPAQWADADGDGFFDARWTELVDVADPAGPRAVVPSEGQLRWFVAARAVDLGGRVDVNTARAVQEVTDPSGPVIDGRPDNAARLGATPADVDLRRLLTLEEPWAMFASFYGDGPQPAGGAADYSAYSNDAVAREAGENGYKALRAVAAGAPLQPGQLAIPPVADAGERRDGYIARSPGDAPLRTSEGLLRQPSFGKEDLADLLAFGSLNDDRTLSELERTAGGRALSSPSLFNLSPLRENRPLSVERPVDDVDEALALRAADARRHLTTRSGAIPRLSGPVDITRFAAGAVPTGVEALSAAGRLEDAPLALDPADPAPTLSADGYRLLELAAPAGTGSVPGRLDRNAHPLFRAYASALLPSAGEPGAWSDPQWASTFFGFDPAATTNDPLFALRTAAHMAANMIDAYDDDDVQSGLTLLVDGTGATRSRMEGGDPTYTDTFPWWSEPEMAGGSTPGVSGRLDLGDDRLPDPADVSGVEAMNVYGLEAHPFITQAALFNLFTDANSTVGDDEFVPPPPPGGGGPIISPSPPLQPITLDTTADSANADYLGQVLAVQLTNPYTTPVDVDGDYLVRFGAAPDLRLPPATIEPGQSLTLFAVTGGLSELESRASVAAVTFGQPTREVSLAEINAWLDAQFTADRVEFASGFDTLDNFLVSTPGDTSPTADANREVTLWRELTREGPLTSATTTEVMLDRLFDPADLADRPTLDRRPPESNRDVTGTLAGRDDAGPIEARDNTGFTVATWGTITRPVGEVAAPRGALPAYVLEKPFASTGVAINGLDVDGLPVPPGGGGGTFDIDRGDFVGGGTITGTARTLRDFFDSTEVLAEGLALEMREIQDRVVTPTPDPPPDYVVTLDASAHPDGTPFDELHVQPLRNDNRGLLDGGQRMLRPGDFLGVPAVGPVQVPLPGDPLNLAWFTTGELLTLALGYDRAPPVGSGLEFPSLPERTDELLDRGHLPLGAPAPFVDRDTNGVFDPPPFGDDESRGLGVPHAMALASRVRTAPGEAGGPGQPVVGLVNVNTATAAVARVLPGLTPTFEGTIDPAFNWIADAGGTVLHDNRSDVGAGVLAYRDKSERPTRPGGVVGFLGSGATADGDPFDLVGRFETTDVEGIREGRGLLSVGELLAVHAPPTGSGLGGSGTYPQPHFIQRLGEDGLSLDVNGVDSLRYGPAGEVDLAADGDDDGIADDYDERLALFNGLANTASVRGDVFAIWFVLHGYARGDVEGLRPDQPLTPSVARRYLMVVDRSNVTQAGDSPQVLLFEELPL